MNYAQGRRFALNMMLLGVVVIVVAFAVNEFASRGTSGVGGISIANYKAEAEVQDRPAPDFTLPALDGSGAISLHSFRGAVVVLNFWGSWCGPCRLEAPGLERTWQAYRDRGVRFLGVDERDNDAAARAFVDEFQLTYPSAVDPGGTLADDYEIFGMPTTYVIDPGGGLRYRFVGYLEAPILQRALNDVIDGASP